MGAVCAEEVEDSLESRRDGGFDGQGDLFDGVAELDTPGVQALVLDERLRRTSTREDVYKIAEQMVDFGLVDPTDCDPWASGAREKETGADVVVRPRLRMD